MVEAYAAGRKAVGADLNTLSIFIAQAKTTPLSPAITSAIQQWGDEIVPELRCSSITANDTRRVQPTNLTGPQARWIRKIISLSLDSIDARIQPESGRRFARCAVLNAGQWALNGRRTIPTANEFRHQLRRTVIEMLSQLSDLRHAATGAHFPLLRPLFFNSGIAQLRGEDLKAGPGLADLVVTSPPYPGIHMLYHRWQVDGRKESNAPYWITGCADGHGSAHYTFAHRGSIDLYFRRAESAFGNLRCLVRSGAILAQLVAFSNPQEQFSAYLKLMSRNGFRELPNEGSRIWRDIPGRRWHANWKGSLQSSREVVLVHEAC